VSFKFRPFYFPDALCPHWIDGWVDPITQRGRDEKCVCWVSTLSRVVLSPGVENYGPPVGCDP
jgi:hypothetical protein